MVHEVQPGSNRAQVQATMLPDAVNGMANEIALAGPICFVISQLVLVFVRFRWGWGKFECKLGAFLCGIMLHRGELYGRRNYT